MPASEPHGDPTSDNHNEDQWPGWAEAGQAWHCNGAPSEAQGFVSVWNLPFDIFRL